MGNQRRATVWSKFVAGHDYYEHCRLAPRFNEMKRILFAAIAVVAVFLAYRSWPLVSAAQLGSAIQRGDQQEVNDRIDFIALRRSLGRQVARAYLEESGRGKELGGLGRSAAIGAGTLMAQAYLEEILTPQNVLAMLREGRVPSANNLGQATTIDSHLPKLHPMTGEFLSIFFSSGFSSPMHFVVRAGNSKPANASYGLVFALQGLGWRLVEFELPTAIVQQFVRELALRVNSSERR